MLARINDYDVILLDLMLPKKNGLQVAAELRREGRRTPILMLTARAVWTVGRLCGRPGKT